jgi:hypothetical protein
MALWSRRVKAPISRFSRTVIRGKMRRPSGDWAIPISATAWPGMFWISRPLKTILPVRGGTIPEIERSVVDLPAPLAPMSVTISPSRTSSEMPLSASIEP